MTPIPRGAVSRIALAEHSRLPHFVQRMRFTTSVSFRAPSGESGERLRTVKLLSGVSISLTSFDYRNVETATFYVLWTELAGRLALLLDGCEIGTDNSRQTTDDRQPAGVASGGVNLADGRWRPKYMGA
jgi:hypothetical protein